MKEFDTHNTKWWLPNNLQKKEDQFQKNEINLDNGDDFGSYRIMLESNNVEKSYIQAHNDISPDIKISMIKDYLKKKFPEILYNKVFNLGCGLGFESKYLSRIFKSKVLGIDISTDAIEYANKNFSNDNIKFQKMAVDGNFKLNDKYDIGFAFEFYPFTRNNDKDFQFSILDAIFKNLKNKGIVVIYQLYENEESIKDNLDYLSKKLNKKYIKSKRMHVKIYKKTHSFFLTNLLSYAYNLILHKKDISKRVIVFY